jgi:hypothetical protein
VEFLAHIGAQDFTVTRKRGSIAVHSLTRLLHTTHIATYRINL